MFDSALALPLAACLGLAFGMRLRPLPFAPRRLPTLLAPALMLAPRLLARLAGIPALARPPNLVEEFGRRGGGRDLLGCPIFAWRGRKRLGAGNRCELAPLAPEAERFQDRAELLARAADHRHQIGHHAEAAVSRRAGRRGDAAL